MLAASRADLSKAFCSYCGYPPMGPWRLRAHRVCMRCQMGMVLRAPPNAQPRFDEPFLIVDERLIVQAISHRAERLLMVNEPDGFGVSLEEFLVSTNGDADGRGPRPDGGAGDCRRRHARVARAANGARPRDLSRGPSRGLRTPTSRAVDPGCAQARHPAVIERASTPGGEPPAPRSTPQGRGGG